MAAGLSCYQPQIKAGRAMGRTDRTSTDNSPPHQPDSALLHFVTLLGTSNAPAARIAAAKEPKDKR
jgi:hypothetical protein